MSRSDLHPSSKINALILKKKLEEKSNTLENKGNSNYIEKVIEGIGRDDSVLKPRGEEVTVAQLDEEDHPERAIPDIPENKRVRDFLRSMPLTGHGAAFGKAIYVVQCYRCKCYGHRAGDPECKYTVTGDLNLELQRRIREDPLRVFKRIEQEEKPHSKVERMKALLEEAKQERRHRHHHKRRKDSHAISNKPEIKSS